MSIITESFNCLGKKNLKANVTLPLLYTLPMNINSYVLSLIKTLDTKIYKVVTTSNGYLFHATGKYCIML